MDLTLTLTIVVIILLMIVVAVPLISFLTDRRLFAGYRDVRAEVRYVAEMLKGKVSRSENDLVISGIHSGSFSVEARISNDDYRPALIVRMLTPPLPLSFSIRPKKEAKDIEWRPVRMSDPYLNARFGAFADDPDLADWFFDDETALKDLQQLCWSSSNYVSMMAQQVELIELTLPNSAQGAHCLKQIRAMARLVARAQELPGAKMGEFRKGKRKRYLLVRSASAIAAVVALAALLSTGSPPGIAPPTRATAVRGQTETMPPPDASRIHGLEGWRMAAAGDFDPIAVQWLRQQAQTPSGHLPGDFSGTANGHDVAYVLTRDDGAFRLVMLVGNAIACDVNYRHIKVAGVVRKDQLASTDWVDGRTRTPDGDGLLIVLDPHDATSGLVLFEQGGALHSARPVDYRRLNLG
jgi:hypothetical protein